MDMTISYVPVPTQAQDETPHVFPYHAGEPLPEIGESVAFGDWTRVYRVVSRSLHYVDDHTLQIFYGYERQNSVK